MRKDGLFSMTPKTLLMILIMTLFPALANAWTFPVKVTNTTAGINIGNKVTVTIGTVSTDVTVGTKYFYPANTVTSVSVAIANIQNVESITLDSVSLPLTTPVTVIKGTASTHSLNIVYSTAPTTQKRDVTLTQSFGGITTLKVGGVAITTGGFTDVPVGTGVEVTAHPSYGFKLVKITVNGTDDTAGAGSTSAVIKTFLVDGAFTPNTVTVTFAVDPMITSASLSVPPSAIAGTPVQAVTTASSNVSPIYYAYTTTCSGESQAAGINNIFNFTPAAPGTCTVTVRVTAGTATPALKTATVSVVSAVTGTSYICIVCHASGTPYVVNLYNESPHAPVISCQDCHTDSPHSIVPTGAVCSSCHTVFPSYAPHSDYIGTDICTTCHNPHSTISSMAPAAHYNNITTGTYPASYVTSRSACTDCHVKSAANRSIRQEWASSAHANTAGLPWTARDFKTLAGCVHCHTTTGFIAYSTGRVIRAWGSSTDYTKEVLTCIGCHSDITAGVVRKVSRTKPYAFDPYTTPEAGTSNICMGCHSGLQSGLAINRLVPGANFGNLPFIDPHQSAAAGTLNGVAGYHFPGRTYSQDSGHVKTGAASGDGPCVSCHKSAASGHTFVASAANPVCAGCHTDSISEAALTGDRTGYNDSLLVLRTQLAINGYLFSSAEPRFAATNWGTGQGGANTMGAAFNYALLSSEPGAYAHNSTYAKQLIFDSIDYLHNGTITGDIGTSLSSLVDSGDISQQTADSVSDYKAQNVCTLCHNPGTTGSHPAHLNDGILCADCHYGTAATNTTLVPGNVTHLNNQRDVAIGPANNPGGNATYSTATDTCSSVTCHAGGPRTWGSGPVGCESCHTGTLSMINGITAQDMSLASTRGHGKTGIGRQCLDCHDRTKRHRGGSGRLRDALGGTLNTGCNYCHDNAAIIPDARFRNMSTHFSKDGGQAACADCHDLHGTTNLSMIRTSIIGQPITYTDRSTGLVNTTTNQGLCQVCHTATSHYQAGVAETQHPTTSCLGCHNHNAAGGAFQPNGTCDACHGYPPAPRGATAPAYGTLNNWTSARFQDYSGGGGAHLVAAHVPPAARASGGWGNCTLCHPSENHLTQLPVAEHIANLTIGVDKRYRFSDTFITYSGARLVPSPAKNATGACFNVSCHMSPSPKWEEFGQADMTCASCHRMPPLDAADGARDLATGAVKGNHQGHAGSSAASCVKCHGADPATYTTAHGNGAIQFAANINNSPKIGGASYSRAFANQTSVPPDPLGTCSSVDCHFEAVTPAWGSAPFSSSADCVVCHGVAPATGSHPVAGSKHGAYYGTGTGSCVKCHPDHLAGAKPFAHASSTTSRGIVVRFTAAPNNGGVYSGPVNDYLPSQTNEYGNCAGLYCHSNGAGGTPTVVPAWGGSLDCAGCHGSPPAYVNGESKANSHASHNYGCNTCHASTTSDGATIADPSLHANGGYDVTAGGTASFTYAYAAGGGTCSAISCHGNGTATWGVPLGCDGCHDAPPNTASHLKHYGGTVEQAAYGDTRITQDFGATGTAYVFGCGNCHPQDLAKHGNGTIEVELYNAAATAGSPKKISPESANYVRGTTLTDSRGYAYSNGTCSNIYCHSYRSWTTPTPVPNSTTCAPPIPADLVTTTNYKTVTWGGAALDCAGCHENPPRTRSPGNSGAAGDSHSWISPDDGYGSFEYLHNNNMNAERLYEYPYSKAISCMYCHNATVREPNTNTYDFDDPAVPVIMSNAPINNFSNHVNGNNDVAFEKQIAVPSIGDWTDQKLTNATYTPATKTCSNVACHLQRKDVKWGTPYKGYFEEGYACARCHDFGITCQDFPGALTRQPSITSTPTSTLASPGYPYSYTVSASEPGGGAITYALTTAPADMSISSSGVISWTPTAGQLGNAPVTVVASSVASSGNLKAIQEFTISVVQSIKPVISSTAPTTAWAWTLYSYQVIAKVPSGTPAITGYTLTNAPPGMTVTTGGNIRWTPTDLQMGDFTVTVTVSAGSNSSTQTFTIHADQSLINFTSTPVLTAQSLVTYNYEVTVSPAPPPGYQYTFGLLTKPTGMSIGLYSGLITWTPTAIQYGSFPVVVNAASNGGSNNRQRFIVSTPSPIITITSTPILVATATVPYSYTVRASMAGVTTGFTYALTNRPTSPLMSINSTTGVITWTPLATNKAIIYPISVTATKSGTTATQSFFLTVNP